MNNTKTIIGRVLSDLIPGTGLIAQNGAQWKFARPVKGLESFSTRTYNSQNEVIDVLSDHYASQFEGTRQTDNVAGLPRPEAAAADHPANKKAV